MYRYGGMGRSSRSGLGQTLNCPGDPGCPGNPVPPGTPQNIAEILYASNVGPAYVPQSPPLVPAPAAPLTSAGFTRWINANAVTVLIGAAVFLVAWKVIQK